MNAITIDIPHMFNDIRPNAIIGEARKELAAEYPHRPGIVEGKTFARTTREVCFRLGYGPEHPRKFRQAIRVVGDFLVRTFPSDFPTFAALANRRNPQTA